MQEFKGLRSFLSSKINEFNAEVFSLESDKNTIKDALERVICVDTPYWNNAPVGGDWGENWSFIEMKNNGYFDKVRIGFCVLPNKINIVAFDTTFGNDFSTKYHEVNVSRLDCWLDLGCLYNEILPIVERCLRYSNRSEHSDAF